MNASELFDLSGKVAVITGGAGSIGIAYGRALGEAGASVVLADVDEGAATTAAGALAGRRLRGHRRRRRREGSRVGAVHGARRRSTPSAASTSS